MTISAVLLSALMAQTGGLCPTFSQVGSGCAGSNGLTPQLAVVGTLNAPVGQALLEASQLNSAALLSLMLGTSPAALQAGGCTVWLSPLLVVNGIQPNASGVASFPISVELALLGVDLLAQVAQPDSGTASGWSLSNAIKIDFTPDCLDIGILISQLGSTNPVLAKAAYDQIVRRKEIGVIQALVASAQASDPNQLYSAPPPGESGQQRAMVWATHSVSNCTFGRR